MFAIIAKYNETPRDVILINVLMLASLAKIGMGPLRSATNTNHRQTCLHSITTNCTGPRDAAHARIKGDINILTTYMVECSAADKTKLGLSDQLLTTY